MRDVAHSAASPDQAPYAVAEAVFADAKAYLSSREAQQMSESELERELHRRGQELMPGSCKDTSINAPRGRPPVRSRGSTMSSARSGVCRNATRRRPSGRCRLRARAGRARRWRRDAAQPRERRRRPYGVVIDLIHVAEYVCKAVPVFHRHRRHRRGVRYLVRDRDGVHWCTLVLPSTAVSSMRGPGSAGWRTGLEPGSAGWRTGLEPRRF